MADTMRFGSREICNVVFRATAEQKIGSATFKAKQPVLYIDSAKTSTVESSATSVYATGGRGNTRLLTWEGEKTLTFTVEDALLSPISFSMLSGAGVVDLKKQDVYVHTTSYAEILANGTTFELLLKGKVKDVEKENMYVIVSDNGSITGDALTVADVSDVANNKVTVTLKDAVTKATTVFVDFYAIYPGTDVTELQIDAEHFGGFYYVEADTLFRRESDGKDLPANFTLPKVKIQSNFSFAMAASGDPSTFTFTMDAMPGYTYFNNTKKVLCAIQIIDDTDGSTTEASVFATKENQPVDIHDELADSENG